MKKIVLLLLFLFVLVGCSNGGEKEYTITFTKNASDTREWKYTILDEGIVEMKHYTSREVDNGEIELKYTFVGLSKGKTQIIFDYATITNDIEKTEKFDVDVDSDLNVVIKQK